jgi:two-component system, response regulator YesN
LINTDKKIYEICSEIGYTEPKYFIKRFRQIVGVTPKEYRKIYTS